MKLQKMEGVGDDLVGGLIDDRFELVRYYRSKRTLKFEMTLEVIKRATPFCFQERLYSGSHNAIDVWESTGSFQSLGKIDHECGSVYSLAVTKMFIIAGNSGGHMATLWLAVV
jgi:hypothetical protein